MDAIIKSLGHPEELLALLKFRLLARRRTPQYTTTISRTSLRTCYEYLNKTSRSFAAVIQALDGDLRHATCIFYLVLRALDTVEDDMSIPVSEKVPLLTHFHTHLTQPHWCYRGSKERDALVLDDFTTISKEFRWLSPTYQEVISDICARMGRGMVTYLQRDVHSLADWDQYCHYVAGLVGIGLSRLFSASELEDTSVGQNDALANSMGLFLQKTNIIRDFLEDYTEARVFWPSDVWTKYTPHLRYFIPKPHRTTDTPQPPTDNTTRVGTGNGCVGTGKTGDSTIGTGGDVIVTGGSNVRCLNELITNALSHIPDVISYLSTLRNPSVFNFCAIPQVMAVSTLCLCYNNSDVFTGVVKLRRGQTIRLMMGATDMQSVKRIFADACSKMLQKVDALAMEPAASPGHTHTAGHTDMAGHTHTGHTRMGDTDTGHTDMAGHTESRQVLHRALTACATSAGVTPYRGSMLWPILVCVAALLATLILTGVTLY